MKVSANHIQRPDMDKDQQLLFDRFDELGIKVQTKSHEAAFTVEDARKLRGQIPGGHCKNLFLKDKKGVIWLIVCLEETVINLKTIPKVIGSARLSFGNPDLMMEKLGITPGSVTPFALISDTENDVNVILEKSMMEHKLLNFHPLRNDQTTTIKSTDLLKFISSCGHHPQILPLADQ